MTFQFVVPKEIMIVWLKWAGLNPKSPSFFVLLVQCRPTPLWQKQPSNGKKGKTPFVWRKYDKRHTFKLANVGIVPRDKPWWTCVDWELCQKMIHINMELPDICSWRISRSLRGWHSRNAGHVTISRWLNSHVGELTRSFGLNPSVFFVAYFCPSAWRP